MAGKEPQDHWATIQHTYEGEVMWGNIVWGMIKKKKKGKPWGHFYWFQVELCRLIMEEKISTDSSMLTFKLVIRTKQAERDL